MGDFSHGGRRQVIPVLGWVIGSCIALGLAFVLGFMIGCVKGNLQIYHNRFEEERSFVAPIIAAEPAFATVQIRERSNGGVYLIGEVDSKTDLDLLRNHMLKALGDLRGSQIMFGVSVRK